jgi:hypothetical protein
MSDIMLNDPNEKCKDELMDDANHSHPDIPSHANQEDELHDIEEVLEQEVSAPYPAHPKIQTQI